MRIIFGLSLLAFAVALAGLELMDRVDACVGQMRKERRMTQDANQKPVVTVDAKPLVRSLSAQGLALAALAAPIASLCEAAGIPVDAAQLESALHAIGMALAFVGVIRRGDISGLLKIRS